jgi:hypothetical protein
MLAHEDSTGGKPPSGVPRRGRDEFTLGLGAASVHVRSEVPGVLPWVREALMPAFREVTADHTTLHAVIAPEWDGDEPVDGPELPCFALDQTVVMLPGQCRDGALHIEHERYGARYTLRPGKVTIRPTMPEAGLREASFRVIRELLLAQILREDRAFQLHASALEWCGRVVLFGGPKRAGKTTALARVASATGAAVVANDRVIAFPELERWRAHGVPTEARIRRSTMALLPDLFMGIPDVEQPLKLTLAEWDRAAARHGVLTEPANVAVSPAQLVRELGVSACPGGELSCVALVGVDESGPPFAIRPISQREAADSVTAIRFGGGSEPRPSTVFDCYAGAPLGAAPSEPELGSLTSEVRWVEVRLSPAFASSLAPARELLSTLIGGA